MKEDLLDSVRSLREEIRKKVKDEVLSEYNEARKDGKYPWEGMWLTPEQISMVQQRLKKKDKVVFLEIMVFFSILFLVILPVFYSFTVSIIPRKNGEDSNIFKGVVRQSPASPDLKGTASKSGEDGKMKGGRKYGRQELSRVSSDTNRSDRFTENRRGKVNIYLLKLREGPGIRYPVISKLKYGESITVQDKDGIWLRIMTDNSLVGWVSGEYIKLIDLTETKDLISSLDDGGKSPGVLSADEKNGGPLKSEASANPGKTVSQTNADRHDEYYVQVGSWKKVSYARKVAEKLKARYPGVFIEQRNNMYKVRIPEILGEEQGAAILKEIRENFNFTPLLVKRK